MKNIIFFVEKQITKAGYLKKTEVKLTEPLVSFTFDDAPASAFENGGAILSKYGLAATYYISLSFLDSGRSDASFSKEHLAYCIETGGELACHTFNHIHFRGTDPKKIAEDLDKNAAELKKLFPQQEFKNFAYPFGEQTLRGKKLVRNRFRSARSICPGINRGKTDLNSLKAAHLYEDTVGMDYIDRLIAETKQTNGWLIFYTHDVRIHHSACGCSPSYFESVVKKCAGAAIKTMTVDAVLNSVI